ncbi:hypothetical protein EDB89DRAFT_2245947, partial [Lactarius sanguifluus]
MSALSDVSTNLSTRPTGERDAARRDPSNRRVCYSLWQLEHARQLLGNVEQDNGIQLSAKLVKRLANICGLLDRLDASMLSVNEEELAAQLVHMAGQLRRNAELFSGALAADQGGASRREGEGRREPGCDEAGAGAAVRSLLEGAQNDVSGDIERRCHDCVFGDARRFQPLVPWWQSVDALPGLTELLACTA